MINKKRVALFLVGFVAIVLAGCVMPSLHPFYLQGDLTFDQALIGNWQADNVAETWTFEKNGDYQYKFLMNKHDQTNVLAAHLFKLKGQRFLDCVFSSENEFGIPAHYLLKVNQIEPTLKLSTLNPNWVKELLDKNPKAIAHRVVEDRPGNSNETHIVLTAETKSLQKFVTKALSVTNAFPDLDEMKRVK